MMLTLAPATDSLIATAKALLESGSKPTHWLIDPLTYIGMLVELNSGTERDIINSFERIHYLQRWYVRHGRVPRWPSSLEGLWAPPTLEGTEPIAPVTWESYSSEWK